MADITYRVVVDLATRGDFGGVVDRNISKAMSLDSAISKLGTGAVSMADSMATAFESAVESAATLVAHVATLGAGAAFAGITYGVVKLNRELETTQIGLAAIFGAQGITSSMNEGMSIAAGLMDKMRTDAASLPGTFSDLVSIFRTISVPAFQAGASVNQVRKLASVAMATSVSIGLPTQQAGRELAMLLEGRAGAHNVFGLRLAGLAGDKAKEFNRLAAPERMAAVTKELGKYSDALEVYKNSFQGLWTTLRDNGSKFVAAATTPLFTEIKHSMAEANDWFTQNHALVGYWADSIGSRLAQAFRVGEEKIKEWWPYITAFAQHAEERIKRIWQHIKPEFRQAEAFGKHLLGDDATFDKLGTILKLYAGVKVGHRLLDAAPSPTTIAMLLGRGGPLLGQAAGAGGAAEGGIAAGLASPVGIAAVVGAIGLLIATFVAVEGAIHSVTDSTSMFHDEALLYWNYIKEKGGSAFSSIHHAAEAAEPYVQALADKVGVYLLEKIDMAANAVAFLGKAIDTLATVAEGAAEKLGVARAHHLNNYATDTD